MMNQFWAKKLSPLSPSWLHPSRQTLAYLHRGGLFVGLIPSAMAVFLIITIPSFLVVWFARWAYLYHDLERLPLVLAFFVQFLELGIFYLIFRITMLRRQHLSTIPAGDFVPLEATALLLRWIGEMALLLPLPPLCRAVLQPVQTYDLLARLSPFSTGHDWKFMVSSIFFLPMIPGFLVFWYTYSKASKIELFLKIERNTNNPTRPETEGSIHRGEVLARSPRSILPSALALTLVLLSPAVQAQSNPLGEADDALSRGNVAQAKVLVASALKKQPRSPQNHLLSGKVSLAEGDLDAARKSFEFALALDPSLRPRIGASYYHRMELTLREGRYQMSQTLLELAALYEADLREQGIAASYQEALRRYRIQDPLGRVMLEHYLANFPSYSADQEDFLFYMGQFFQEEGKTEWAKTYFEKCAGLFPQGELGQEAAALLRPRVITIDKTQNTLCDGRLFTHLERIERGFESTKAVLTWAWVHERGRDLRLRILPSTKLVGFSGKDYPIDTQRHDQVLVGQDITLRSQEAKPLTLYFAPLPEDELSLSLYLANNRCGERTENWGTQEIILADILLNRPDPVPTTADADVPGKNFHPAEDPTPVNNELRVTHIHDYFIGTGTCQGLLRLRENKIVYESAGHSFELPCSDVLGFVQGEKDVWVQNGSERVIVTTATARVEARVLNRKGKLKTKVWHFVAQDGTPPALVVTQNRCFNH